MLDPLFNGKAINPNYTNNDSLLDDPQVNAAIEKAKKSRTPRPDTPPGARSIA